jgi:hypothetical protein
MLNGRNATDSFLSSGHDHPLRLRIAPAMERCGRKIVDAAQFEGFLWEK